MASLDVSVDQEMICLDGDDEQETSGSTKKRTSKVWKDFTWLRGDIARCNHCKQRMVHKATSGTSHLKNHLPRCDVLKIKRGGQLGSPKVNSYKFSQENSRIDLAKMIIKHKYPFNMVNHEFFEIFCNGLNPNFKVVSRNTIRSNILQVHLEEKEKMYNLFEGLSSKVTLTTDIWTPDHQNFAYTCLTAHFIDDDWQLKKKILNYRQIEYPHDGDTLFRFISDLILYWNLDKKIIAIVVDNATSNDSMVARLMPWLLDNSRLSLGGSLFHIRCSAHILNLIVQDGLKVIGGILTKIRESVKYLSRSSYGKQKFDSAVNQVKLKGRKKVPMDVSNRWNSTYLMLEAALELKEAFCRLDTIDRNYKHNPTVEEWEVAHVINDCLRVFYDATSHLSGVNFPTANVFSLIYVKFAFI